MSKLKKIILLFIITIIFGIIAINTKSNAVNINLKEGTYKNLKDPFYNTDYDSNTSEEPKWVYCREKGGEIFSGTKYKKDGNGLLSEKLAYALYLAEGNKVTKDTYNTKIQQIIWQQYSGSSLNLGTTLAKNIWNPTCSSDAREIIKKAQSYKSSGTIKPLNTNSTKAVKKDNYYLIGPIQLKFTKSDTSYISKIQLSGKNNKGNDKVLDLTLCKKDGTEYTDGFKAIKSGNKYYLKCTTDISGYSNLKVKGVLTYKIYSGRYQYYSGEERVKSSKFVQNMVYVTAESESKTKPFEIPIDDEPTPPPPPSPSGEVRLVTVKYISEVNGEDVTNIAPRTWVEVHTDKEVDDEERYTIHKQDTSKLLLNPGDIVEYTIIVYNVGDTKWDPLSSQYFDSPDDYVIQLTNVDAGARYKSDFISYVCDKPENYTDMTILNRKDNYEPLSAEDLFTADWWEKDTLWNLNQNMYVRPIMYKLSEYDQDKPDGYRLAEGETAAPGYKNCEYNEKGKMVRYAVKIALGEGTTEDRTVYHKDEPQENETRAFNINNEPMYNRWHTHIYFRINEEGNIKNNDLNIHSEEKYIKYIYSITDEKGNEIELKEKPQITADPINLSETTPTYNHPDTTVMKGYKIKYGIRYYSVGENERLLNYYIYDTFSQGLKYEEIEGASISKKEVIKEADNENGVKLTIDPPKITLRGYDPNRPGTVATNETNRIGSQNGFQYYEILLTFEVSEYLNPMEISYLTNTTLKNSTIIPTGYEIKGIVFIDKDLEKAGDRDDIWSGGKPDELVEGIKVELLNEEGKKIDKIIDEATGKEYPTTVYTNSDGEYKFTHLRAKKISIDKDGEIQGEKDVSTPYRICFTYNGQEYENIFYNKDSGKGNGSYATEGKKNREDFNTKFSTIASGNSSVYSLKSDLQKDVKIKPVNNSYKISSYTGGYGIEELDRKDGIITVDTSYKEHVNLGLVERNFDLKLDNRLASMEVEINGTKEKITSINGSSIKEKLKEEYIKEYLLNKKHDVSFKESDYKYINDKELSVWVNYEVSIKNASKNDFIGVLNSVKFYYDNRFDNIKITNITNFEQSYNSANMNGIKINLNSKEIKKGEPLTINISLHLSRKTIENYINSTDKGTFETLQTIAEIESYGSKYNGDIYNNGHGIKSPNAGKIDENSNAGNFEIESYEDKDKTEENRKEMIRAEDDVSRAERITLIKDDNPRTLKGIVFEDATKPEDSKYEVEGKIQKTRFGDGIKKDDKEDLIENIKVELYEYQDGEYKSVNVYDSEKGVFKESAVKSNNSSGYEIKGFIPSNNYVLKFTYGDGTTIYNAQDYKSTVDKTNNTYNASIAVDENGYSSNIEKNYWYNNIKEGRSVAKDEDTKMTEGTLTNSSAIKLENCNELNENTATTARFCVPLTENGDQKIKKGDYIIKNMNLGLAERPRSELTIKKQVDHISIIATDGSTIVDGTQGAKSISWTDKYVQPIVDENLIYGSKLTVTYKITVENTGEIDYDPGEAQLDGYNKTSSKDSTRKFYDYGDTEGLSDEKIVTTQAKQIIDYTDNNLTYNENENNDWKIATDDVKKYLDENSEVYYDTVTTKLITTKLNVKLKPGEKTKNPVYLTQTKILSSNDTNDQMEYNNYVEIIESTNSAGRRSYHTIPVNTDGTTISTDEKDYNGVLLSEVENRGANPVNMSNDKTKYLVLSIPGDLGDPDEIGTTTLNWEPDSDEAQEIQIIQPFGDEKNYNITILAIIITTSGIILAGGIYLIKKKVLGK